MTIYNANYPDTMMPPTLPKTWFLEVLKVKLISFKGVE